MKRVWYIVVVLTLLGVADMHGQQYKYEAGPALGVTGYLGECNNGFLFKHPSVTAGGIFRYNHNSRWAFKANLNYANIRGNSMYDETWYPDGLNYTCSASLIDLGMTAEFNFLNFGAIGIGVKYKFKQRLNLGFEFTMRKEFSDRIDGHSDLFGIKHSFAKNTDWYSFAMFTATYEFGKRCIKCNYIE